MTFLEYRQWRGPSPGSIADEDTVDRAMSERFYRLAPMVQGMAQRMRPADEDMQMTGLAKLWELIVDKDEERDHYLIAAVRNAMIDRIRYHKVRAIEKQVEDVCGSAEGGAGADALMEVDIVDLLGLLPARERVAFRLHCLRDYTIAQTARKLRTSERTVKRLIARAKSRLRLELE